MPVDGLIYLNHLLNPRSAKLEESPSARVIDSPPLIVARDQQR
jgi:hypothetical protein